MKKIVISIDGGGIRGILPLVLLREISKHTNKDLNEEAIEWWGTSTGAIVSGALCIQQEFHFDRAVQQVLDLYEFRSATSIHPGNIPHPERAFNQMIDANFKGLDLCDYPNFHCVVTDMVTNTPVIIDADWNTGLDEAIRASCAFPGLFPPVYIGERPFSDGFLHAKNPSKLALEYHLNIDYTPDLFISLGTGIMRENDAIELAVESVDAEVSKVLGEMNIPYYRLNPTLILGSDDMQNITPKNIHHLKQDSLEYIEGNEALFAEIADVICG